jgi:hypothetical protein
MPRAGFEPSTRLRPRDHWDRPYKHTFLYESQTYQVLFLLRAYSNENSDAVIILTTLGEEYKLRVPRVEVSPLPCYFNCLGPTILLKFRPSGLSSQHIQDIACAGALARREYTFKGNAIVILRHTIVLDFSQDT